MGDVVDAFLYNKSTMMSLRIILFIILFLLIVSQVYTLTKFVLEYNYFYNYGYMLKGICKTAYTEYETNRFQIAKENIKIEENDSLYDGIKILLALVACIMMTIVLFITFIDLAQYAGFCSTIAFDCS